MDKTDIKSMNLEELTEYITSLGEAKFRAKQIYEWLQVKGVSSFSQMTNLPKSLIKVLDENYIIKYADIEKRFPSRLDETVKFLYKLFGVPLLMCFHFQPQTEHVHHLM